MDKLTDNEKKVLKILLRDARRTDKKISTKLGISNQAVGRIRKKLEKEYIQNYGVILNNSKLNLGVFAISFSRLKKEALDEGELEVEEKMKKEPNILQIYKIPDASRTYILNYSFRDMEELERFFAVNKTVTKYLDNLELFKFSGHSIIKDDMMGFLEEKIEGISDKRKAGHIKEIEEFKKKIGQDV